MAVLNEAARDALTGGHLAHLATLTVGCEAHRPRSVGTVEVCTARPAC